MIKSIKASDIFSFLTLPSFSQAGPPLAEQERESQRTQQHDQNRFALEAGYTVHKAFVPCTMGARLPALAEACRPRALPQQGFHP